MKSAPLSELRFKACGIAAAGSQADVDFFAGLDREFPANIMLRVFIGVGSVLERFGPSTRRSPRNPSESPVLALPNS